MIRRPTGSTRTDTLCPDTTLFQSTDSTGRHRALAPSASRPAATPAIASSPRHGAQWQVRSEEHTSELQSLMRISYAVFCLKKKIIDYQYLNLYSTSLLNI